MLITKESRGVVLCSPLRLYRAVVPLHYLKRQHNKKEPRPFYELFEINGSQHQVGKIYNVRRIIPRDTP